MVFDCSTASNYLDDLRPELIILKKVIYSNIKDIFFPFKNMIYILQND